MKKMYVVFLGVLVLSLLLGSCGNDHPTEFSNTEVDQVELNPAGLPIGTLTDLKTSVGSATKGSATNDLLSLSPWALGDVFAAVGGGIYQVYDNAGNFKETISDGLGGFTTGCACDPGLTKLYTTNFSNTKVVVYDKTHPHAILQVVDTNLTSPGGHSESIVFAADGSYYVGHPDGNDLIHHYTAAGGLITTFNVVAIGGGIDPRGTDWIDLTGDQQILFYTGEGRNIRRIDADEDGGHAVPVGLPIFATLPGSGNAFALRLLPPCDGSGGLLVADNGNVKHLDGTGAVFATYDVTGVNGWFSLNLDPDGVHFWAGSFGNRTFYKFPISAVAGNFVDTQVTTVNTALNPNGGSLFGLCLNGEITCGVSLEVPLDIKPQSCPNPLNVNGKGNLPVAILGTDELDVNDIDVSTVQLEGVDPIRSSIEDVATPVTNRQDDCDCTTDGPDGFDDLTLKFDTQDIVLALGAVNDGDEVKLTLTGNLNDGTAITGLDCVVIKKK